MKDPDSPTKITLKTLQSHLLSYESHVLDKIQGLESLRGDDIPETLTQRKKDGNAFLEKNEVMSLVEWKLKHGTYRPNLAKLVASNSIKEIRDTTKSAFAIYEANNDDFAKSVSTLAKLKGIGPATASLLLSCYDSVKVPFFSDELYRYLHFEEAASKGWDRKINYTMKEYKSLFEKLQTLRKRLEKESKKTVSAIDIERMAYVLGKEAPTNDPDIITSTSIDDENEDESNDGLLKPPPKRQKKNPPKAEPLSNSREPNPKPKPKPKSRSSFDPIAEVRRKGLKGSPTYDKHGYELDKAYIIKKTSNRPSSGRSAWGAKAMKHFEMEDKKRKRKVEILFGKGADDDGNILVEDAWDDRVARDLGKAFHEVGMEEYEEWKRKGFKVEAGDFDNLSEKEQKRLTDLSIGSAMRVGSKRR